MKKRKGSLYPSLGFGARSLHQRPWRQEGDMPRSRLELAQRIKRTLAQESF